MKKLMLGLSLVLFAGIAMGQGLAKQQSESIATYLELDQSQKAKVFQVYKKVEDKKVKKHEAMVAANPPSQATQKAKEKSKSNKSKRKNPKASGKKVDLSKGRAHSEIILRLSFNQAQHIEGMQADLKAIFSSAQNGKWMELAGN